jgi:hypothetical protein
MEQKQKQQLEILDGLMLGDGHIHYSKTSKNPYLTITRALKDESYQIYLAKIFENYLTDKSLTKIDRYDKRTEKNYKSIVLRTRSNELFKISHDRWYNHRTKIIPNDLSLTPLNIAIWIADDGYIYHAKNYPNLLHLKLSTNGFQKDEVHFLAKLLKLRYNFDFTVYDKEHDYKLKQYIIRLTNSEHVKQLLCDIDPFFPLDRKSQLWRRPEAKLYERSIEFNFKNKCKFCHSTNICKNGNIYTGEQNKQKYLCKNCSGQFYDKSKLILANNI